MSSRTDTPRSSPWTVALGVTLAVAAALRVLGLNSGLWYDEIVTLVSSVRLPLFEIVTDTPGINAHPLYSVLAHASIAAFGESAWTLRLPACVFGIASVWMAYVLGSRLTSRTEAWAGAAILATSYHHIWFSQNARGYTMLGFLALYSTHLLLRALESRRTRDYVLYALACAAGVYTHLTMGFVVAGQAVALVAFRLVGRGKEEILPLKPVMWAWAGAAVLTALAYAPFAADLMAYLGGDGPRQGAKIATSRWAVAEALRSLLFGTGVPAVLALAAVTVVGAISLIRHAPLAVALLVMPAVVTAAAIVLLGQPFRPRFFFFLSGATAIFVGRGIGAVVGRISRSPSAAREPAGAIVVVTCVLIAVSAIALPRNYRVPKQDFERAVVFLAHEESTGVRIAAAGLACFPIGRYFGKAEWPCLESVSDLQALTAGLAPVRVMYTLVDYTEDQELRHELRESCPVVRTFPGTLGDGEVVVCAPRQREPR